MIQQPKKRDYDLAMSQKNSVENDPCFYEGKASMKCVIDNVGNKDACQKYFESYKKCKKFWFDVYKVRRQADLTPYLPPVNQRQAFVEKYIETKQIPTSVDDVN